MYLKSHQHGAHTLIAVCDCDILGKKFAEGHLKIEVSPDFFGGEKASCSEVEAALAAGNNGQLRGLQNRRACHLPGLRGERLCPLHRWSSLRSDGANVMQAICHRCGLPTVEGLCQQCTLEKATLVSCPDQVEVVICSVCGSRQVKSRWLLPDSCSVEEQAHQAAIDALCLHKELAEPQIELDLRKVGATRYLAKINIDGSFRGQSISEQCEIPVRIKLMACDRCSRMAGKYFQSTVQLRGNTVRSMTAERD